MTRPEPIRPLIDLDDPGRGHNRTYFQVAGLIGEVGRDRTGCAIMKSSYHDVMPKQTTVRLPEELANEAEAVARVKGTSVNALIVDALKTEIERVRKDKEFTDRAKRLIERDRELLDRLAT